MVSFTSGAISGTVSLGHWGSFGGAWPLWERGMGLGWCWEVTTAGTGQEHQVLAHRPVSTPQVAAVLTLPFDVVKTQRQIELGDSEVHPGEGPSSRQVPGEQPGLPVGVSQPSPAPLSPQLQPPSLPPPGCSCSGSAPSLAPGGCLQVRMCPSPVLGFGVPWCHRRAHGTVLAGFLPRVIKVAPACAIMISTYEFGKSFFQKLNQERRLRGL